MKLPISIIIGNIIPVGFVSLGIALAFIVLLVLLRLLLQFLYLSENTGLACRLALIVFLPMIYRAWLSDGPRGAEHVSITMFKPSTLKRLGTVTGITQGLFGFIIIYFLETSDLVVARQFFALPNSEGMVLPVIFLFFCIASTALFLSSLEYFLQEVRDQNAVKAKSTD